MHNYTQNYVFDSNENCFGYLRRTDGRTDDGEFNSTPSSLRETGDKKSLLFAMENIFKSN